MQYAWVLEPHPAASEWPHVHLVHSMPFTASKDEFIGWWRWAREAWAEITGAPVLARIKFQRIYEEAYGVDYLVPYLTGAEFTEEHWAMLYRRRLYGSTLPVEKPEPVGWRILEWMDESRARAWMETAGAGAAWEITGEGPDWIEWRWARLEAAVAWEGAGELRWRAGTGLEGPGRPEG